MAPDISSLSPAVEDVVLSAVLRQWPSLRVDMLTASASVQEGENFMSVVSKVDVVGHDILTGERVENTLILKTLPKCAERCQIFHCDVAFSNEAAFYSRVLPTLLRQTKLSFPQCLKGTDSCILLRHLGQDGFLMADRRGGLDLQHCQLAMQELGRFHAASLALKHQNPGDFTVISSQVEEILVKKDNMIFSACVDNSIDLCLEVAKNMVSPVIQKLRSIRGHGFQVMSPLVAPSEPLAVICHGDLWSNNILFCYSPGNTQTPSDVCFLDLQGSRYTSPALDILYFLFSSSRVGVTRHYFRSLIATYHRSLVEQLRLLAPQAPTVYLSDVTDEVRRYSMYGLVMSLMVLQVATAEDIIINLDGITEEMLMSQEFQEQVQEGLLSPEFRRRVTENLEVFCLEGLL